MVHPFSPERSISACFSCAFHKHAGVSHIKISNFKILTQMASIWQGVTKEPAQNAAPFWRERGTASQKLAGDSWFLFVGIQESRRVLPISFIKIFRIPPRTSYLLPRTCVFVGKHANVLSFFSLKGSPPGFRSDVWWACGSSPVCLPFFPMIKWYM